MTAPALPEGVVSKGAVTVSGMKPAAQAELFFSTLLDALDELDSEKPVGG